MRTLAATGSQLARPGGLTDSSPLPVIVVFTTVEATIQALREAAILAQRLNARITIVDLQPVPYPLPVHLSPVERAFTEKRLRVMAGGSSVQTNVRVYLCRDRVQTLVDVLHPHSLIVLGARKRFWPRPETAMANKLRKAGHEVVLIDAI